LNWASGDSIMRKLIIKSLIILVILFNFKSCLLKRIGQVHASNGTIGNSLSPGVSGTKDNKSSLRSDKEIEDTIREINRYSLSDSLWFIWRAIEDSQFIVAKVDSVNSMKNFAKGVKLAKEGFNLINELKQENLDSLVIRKIKLKAILLFEKARTYFEETFKLNPFDIKTQNYLIWIFQNLAELHDHCDNTLRAINMLECLTFILHDDPKLYYTLGEKYFNIGRWDRALACIRTSIDLILNDDWNKIDTKELFWHYYLKANTEIQLNMIPEALLSLNYAKLIVPGEREANEIQKKIDWINWDDGNIDASRKWDSLDFKLNNGNQDYSTIMQEYTELLRQVKTAGAKQDINWRIAQLEFRFLNEKEKAVERMLNVVKYVVLDSVQKAEFNRCQKYLNDFGSMCYILGMEHLKNNHNKKAVVYFFQSIAYEWNQIGKSYLQLAKLSALDNQAVLRFAKLALTYENHLSNDERNNLYYLFYLAYKRMGKFDVATQWFQRVANIKMG
jgi:tetratricopeptide (TPR) repeat protein